MAPLPLLLLALSWPPRTVVVAAWAIGTLQALLVNGPWLLPAIANVFRLSWPAAAGLLALEAQIVGGVPFALLGALLGLGARLPAPVFVFFAPVCWAAMEYLRGQSPLAAPWALLGAALADQALPIQVADLGGVYAVSFIAVLPAAAAAVCIARRQPGAGAAAAAAALLVLAAVGYGAHRVEVLQRDIAAAPTLRIALVHAELDTAERLAGSRALHNVERHLALGPSTATPVDLVVWPENTVAVLLEENPELVERIAAPAASAPHLVGAPRLVEAPRGLRASAFLIGAGGVEAVYDKRRLLPVAETWGGGWNALLGFGAGGEAVPLPVNGVAVGTSICFEAVFPELARADVRNGAELLVNVSNDSWFGRGAGPDLHFLLGRLRAVETRRALARAANGGVTALVLPDGRVDVSADAAAGTLVVSAPLLREHSIYVRLGDAFAWLCVIATAVGVIVALRRG